MYTRIVVGIDGSELANKALRHAVALAKENHAKLFVVTATESTVLLAAGAEGMGANVGEIIADLEQVKANSAKATLAEAKTRASEQGVTIEGIHIAGSTGADAIISTANLEGADLIVMGSHGRRGLGRLLLGSQAAEVLAHATVPVLVVK